jgi:hypothetical protein
MISTDDVVEAAIYLAHQHIGGLSRLASGTYPRLLADAQVEQCSLASQEVLEYQQLFGQSRVCDSISSRVEGLVGLRDRILDVLEAMGTRAYASLRSGQDISDETLVELIVCGVRLAGLRVLACELNDCRHALAREREAAARHAEWRTDEQSKIEVRHVPSDRSQKLNSRFRSKHL